MVLKRVLKMKNNHKQSPPPKKKNKEKYDFPLHAKKHRSILENLYSNKLQEEMVHSYSFFGTLFTSIYKKTKSDSCKISRAIQK